MPPARQLGLTRIARSAHKAFAQKDRVREEAYQQSREAVRSAASTIRAVHRRQRAEARRLLKATGDVITRLEKLLRKHPNLYYSGFVQDAQKEYAEAACLLAIVNEEPLPTPEGLKVDPAPYLNGLGETVGELRRYILDSLRRDDVSRSEELMEAMDEVYTVLVGMDYPETVTRGLRRTSDMVRGVLERTRGDLTTAMRQRALELRLISVEKGVAPAPAATRQRRARARVATAAPRRPKQVSQPAPDEAVEPYVAKASSSVSKEFQTIRSAILAMGNDIHEVPEKGGRIVYRRVGLSGKRGWQNFCAVYPERKQIKVWLGPQIKWEGYDNIHRDRHYAWYRFRPRRGQGTRQELLELVGRAYAMSGRRGARAAEVA